MSRTRLLPIVRLSYRFWRTSVFAQPVILECHTLPNCLYPKRRVGGKAIPVIYGYEIACPQSTDQRPALRSPRIRRHSVWSFWTADLRRLDARQTNKIPPFWFAPLSD